MSELIKRWLEGNIGFGVSERSRKGRRRLFRLPAAEFAALLRPWESRQPLSAIAAYANPVTILDGRASASTAPVMAGNLCRTITETCAKFAGARYKY